MLGPNARERAEPRVLRAPMRPIPLLDPPKDGESGKRAALALAAALLRDHDRVLLALALAGERVAVVAPVSRT
jgi:hypothetical protein